LFTAVLPRVLDQAVAGPAPQPRAPGPEAPTLLVVEDEPAERQWLTEALTAEGYRVEAVATGAEAIAACRA
jgi:PleD family two-component response regulator